MLGQEVTIEIDLHDAVQDRAHVVDQTMPLGIEQTMTVLDVIKAQVQHVERTLPALKRSHGSHVLIGLALSLNSLEQTVTALKILVQVWPYLTVMLQ